MDDIFLLAGFATELTEMTGIEVNLSVHDPRHLIFLDAHGRECHLRVRDDKIGVPDLENRCDFEVPLADPKALEKIAEGIRECYESYMCENCKLRRTE